MSYTETHVIGPPGTGKTTYLKRQVVRALQHWQPREILVMSFTKAAALNILDKGVQIPRKNVATLHSFCYRLLGKPPIADTKFALYNEKQPTEMQLTGGRTDEDLDASVGYESRTLADEMMATTQSLRARLVPVDTWPDSVRAWFEAWQAWKEDNGLADFTDLLEHAVEDSAELTWETPPKAVFVDEAQDNSPLEMRWIRQLAADYLDHLVIVGDPDQALYNFKGADPKAMTTTDVEHKRIVLSQSWRVPRRVHTLATNLIQLSPEHEPAEYAPRNFEGSVEFMPHITWSEPGQGVDLALAREGTWMFLTTCAYMLQPLKRILKLRAIPFHNPYRLKRADWNPLRTGSGMGTAERMWRFTCNDTTLHGKDARFWGWADLKAWVTPMSARAFKRGMRAHLLRLCKEALDPDAELELEPLLPASLKEFFISEEDFDAAANGDIEWFFDHLQGAQERRFAYPYEIAKRHGTQALRDQPRIVIGTVHSVKGGEAQNVMIFPDISFAAHKDEVQNGSGNNLRTMYVAATRSSEALYVAAHCEAYYSYETERLAQEMGR